MSITAIVENNIIKLPIDVPDGTRVEITMPELPVKDGENALAWMEEFVGCIKDLPEDFAAEHDHNVHGTPKRDDREP